MRVHLSNLGCKLNLAETERWARQLAARGYEVVDSLDAADLHVVNSCTVTTGAARDSRRTLRRGAGVGPPLRTVLTGCWAAAEGERADSLPGVDLVVPNEAKERLVDLLEARFGPPFRAWEPPPCGLALGNARATVKVEDGCNMPCSFCIIPQTRGGQRSRAAEAVVAEVRQLVDEGFQEVVLTGVQISAYRDRGSGLAALVGRLLAETEVPRLRLTSIAPWQLDDELIALFALPRVCRHAHVSLQSGCDATLRRMLRPYTAAAFAERLAALRRAVPAIAVTTDVIVGFPGESDAEAEESLALVARLAFARVHAFPYSERPGTAAATLPGAVPPVVRRERMARLLDVAEESRRRFATARLGELAEVLWEGVRAGLHRGTTDHYLRVVAPPCEARRRGSLGRVRLAALTEDGQVIARPVAA